MSTSSKAQLIRCPACGATNRVKGELLNQNLAPVCGRCKVSLVSASKPIPVTDASFPEIVEASSLPVLVDFWAAWCGPCRLIAPVIDQLAAEFAGRAQIVKLNIDENPGTAARFGVRSIPTLLIFKNGRETDRIVGAQPKQEIIRRLQRTF